MSDSYMTARLSDGPPLPPPTPNAGPHTGGNLGAVPSTQGLTRVVTPDALNQMDAQERQARERRRLEARLEPAMEDLTAFIRKQFDLMRRHRNSSDGWGDRMNNALRMFNGEYPPEVLAEIRQFGGSEIYARLVAVKCRGASAMLRDIYLATTMRPWGISPSPVPTIPDAQRESIESLVAAETAIAAQAAQTGAVDPTTGAPLTAPSEEEIAARVAALESAQDDATRKKARDEAKEAERYLDDLLVEGGFYGALSEFLMDLTMMPFACIRGPVVYMTPSIRWSRGADGKSKLVKENIARMFWKRVSPFDLWWTPGAATVEGANFVYRDRKSRAELNAMLGVAGFRDDNIRKVLEDYPGGFVEATEAEDSIRAEMESRENPQHNESGMYDLLEFHGSVQGTLLRSFGMSTKDVPDEVLDYTVQLWMIGRYVLKVQLSPSPRERPPFYITSYNKVPGTLVGNAIPDVLSDIQDVCNATLRALVNNMAMSSGPQVAINEDILDSSENTDQVWPWRVWKFSTRPGVNTADPVKFFQPASNSQQLLGVYEKFSQIADEISAIPRYMTGSERMGGAGRTASGLAMLMGNASKMLQTVAANIDTDVFEPLLQFLYDIVMLTDQTGRLRGDERTDVKGVHVALQKETERQRQLEVLQATANPMDAEIMGIRGRGSLLRAVTGTLGLDGETIVPSDEELRARERNAQAQAVAQVVDPAAGGAPSRVPPGGPPTGQGVQQGGAETGPRDIPGPRVNLQAATPGTGA